jgi:hypothetical protein
MFTWLCAVGIHSISATIIADAYNLEVEALGAKMNLQRLCQCPLWMSAIPVNQISPADRPKIGPLDPSKGRIPIWNTGGTIMYSKGARSVFCGFSASTLEFNLPGNGISKSSACIK